MRERHELGAERRAAAKAHAAGQIARPEAGPVLDDLDVLWRQGLFLVAFATLGLALAVRAFRKELD